MDGVRQYFDWAASRISSAVVARNPWERYGLSGSILTTRAPSIAPLSRRYSSRPVTSPPLAPANRTALSTGWATNRFSVYPCRSPGSYPAPNNCCDRPGKSTSAPGHERKQNPQEVQRPSRMGKRSASNRITRTGQTPAQTPQRAHRPRSMTSSWSWEKCIFMSLYSRPPVTDYGCRRTHRHGKWWHIHGHHRMGADNGVTADGHPGVNAHPHAQPAAFFHPDLRFSHLRLDIAGIGVLPCPKACCPVHSRPPPGNCGRP